MEIQGRQGDGASRRAGAGNETPGMVTTLVEVLNEQGAQALGKPVGRYLTLELPRGMLRSSQGFLQAARQLGRAVASMVPEKGAVLVAGLGNSAITPDALGPMSLEHLVVTRHLRKGFPRLRAVSAIAPGVLGTTGLESVEVVRGIVERAQPQCVVVVDALAARRLERVCTTVQLADTGLAPGSGVRNSRAAFTAETLGVPVIALGVPTVVDAATLLEDTVLSCGGAVGHAPLCDPTMVVSPKDIDARVERMARAGGLWPEPGAPQQPHHGGYLVSGRIIAVMKTGV